MKIRQDAWSHEDDVLLAETVLTHIEDGSTQLKAFDEVGDSLNRTSAACGFRWNAVIRQKHLNHIEEAKRERKRRKRERSANYFSLYRRPVIRPAYEEQPSSSEQLSGDITIESIITQLKQVSEQSQHSSTLLEENTSLKQQLHQANAKLSEIENQLVRNKQEQSMIEDDYQSLISIMNRARRMSILEENSADDQIAFFADANGNLEKTE